MKWFFDGDYSQRCSVDRDLIFTVLHRARISIFLAFTAMSFICFAQPNLQSDQINFDRIKIKLGARTIEVELADTDSKRAQGLMFRKSMPKDQGMLFKFESSQSLGFWMKNTLIPLSIGYFDSNRILIEVLDMNPALAGAAQPEIYRSSRPARFALEMNLGWFKANKIKPGARFEFVGQNQTLQ